MCPTMFRLSSAGEHALLRATMGGALLLLSTFVSPEILNHIQAQRKRGLGAE
jgi:hypothetical protein